MNGNSAQVSVGNLAWLCSTPELYQLASSGADLAATCASLITFTWLQCYAQLTSSWCEMFATINQN